MLRKLLPRCLLASCLALFGFVPLRVSMASLRKTSWVLANRLSQSSGAPSVPLKLRIDLPAESDSLLTNRFNVNHDPLKR
jgi:hypothetical protein